MIEQFLANLYLIFQNFCILLSMDKINVIQSLRMFIYNEHRRNTFVPSNWRHIHNTDMNKLVGHYELLCAPRYIGNSIDLEKSLI